jgi:hypothetical protein
MNRFFLYLLGAAGLVVIAGVAGPFIAVVLVIAFALSRLIPRLRRALDVNKDGDINIDDLKSIFSNQESAVKAGDEQLNFLKSRLRKVWSRLEHKFVLLSVQIQKREHVANQRWRRLIRYNLDSKVNSLIEELASELEDRELSYMRSDFMACVDHTKSLESKLADLRASIAMNSEPQGGALHRAAERVKKEVDLENQKHAALVSNFQSRINAYGVNLSYEQAEVLLSRVDAGDISRMITIFAIIAGITTQFAEAKRQSGENLEVTKKYYGIYLGLLELQMHIQSAYLQKVDTEYLPGVVTISNEASALIAETEAKLRTSAPEHEAGYRQNIRSQQFTVEVTSAYADALRADRNNVQKARELVGKVYALAENTLSTVRVSADLSVLVRQNESLYKQVVSLQTPALVPFENMQMQREFEAVTARLRSGA